MRLPYAWLVLLIFGQFAQDLACYILIGAARALADGLDALILGIAALFYILENFVPIAMGHQAHFDLYITQ